MISNMLVLGLIHFCILLSAHPHKYPDKFGYVLHYFPYLFGKILFSMQDKVVNNKQTHFLKPNFSAKIAPIDKKV